MKCLEAVLAFKCGSWRMKSLGVWRCITSVHVDVHTPVVNKSGNQGMKNS